jgi:hypothetical protein
MKIMIAAIVCRPAPLTTPARQQHTVDNDCPTGLATCQPITPLDFPHFTSSYFTAVCPCSILRFKQVSCTVLLDYLEQHNEMSY